MKQKNEHKCRNYDENIEKYSSIDYSMSDTPGILDKDQSLSDNNPEQMNDRNKFINVWSVTMGKVENDLPDEEAEDLLSVWTSIFP